MTQWIQDYLPGMEFLGEDAWPPSWFGAVVREEDQEFVAGESCD